MLYYHGKPEWFIIKLPLAILILTKQQADKMSARRKQTY